MEFRDAYSPTEVIYSKAGSGEYKPIEFYYDEVKKKKCFKFGKALSRYDMIQLHKDSCDISQILNRVKVGDTTVLNLGKSVSNLGDITEVPSNIHDMVKMQAAAYESFYKLDPKIQAAFNNDVNVFADAVNKNNVQSYLEKAFKVEEPIKEEIKNEE